MGHFDLHPNLFIHPCRRWSGACCRIGRRSSYYPAKSPCFGRPASNRDPPFDELSILYLWCVAISAKHPAQSPCNPSHKRIHHRHIWLHFGGKWRVDDVCLHLPSRATGKLAVLGADGSWNFHDLLSILGGGRNKDAQCRQPRWRNDPGLCHWPRCFDADIPWIVLDDRRRVRSNGAGARRHHGVFVGLEPIDRRGLDLAAFPTKGAPAATGSNHVTADHVQARTMQQSPRHGLPNVSRNAKGGLPTASLTAASNASNDPKPT